MNERRKEYLKDAAYSLGYDEQQEFKKMIAKKKLDFAFSKDFREECGRAQLLEMHPALQDLYNQYKEMEALLKKENKEIK